jgi:hypothetical protein
VRDADPFRKIQIKGRGLVRIPECFFDWEKNPVNTNQTPRE